MIEYKTGLIGDVLVSYVFLKSLHVGALYYSDDSKSYVFEDKLGVKTVLKQTTITLAKIAVEKLLTQ